MQKKNRFRLATLYGKSQFLKTGKKDTCMRNPIYEGKRSGKNPVCCRRFPSMDAYTCLEKLPSRPSNYTGGNTLVSFFPCGETVACIVLVQLTNSQIERQRKFFLIDLLALIRITLIKTHTVVSATP